eukprot:9503183-Pyramimonas_sp.AAC.1
MTRRTLAGELLSSFASEQFWAHIDGACASWWDLDYLHARVRDTGVTTSKKCKGLGRARDA